VRTAASATPSPTTTSLSERAQAVLRANWREGVHRDGTPYAYTCPATPRYRHQWHWDSCFHAISWRRVDPSRARDELRTLLRSGKDGFLPHTVFWDYPALWRRAPLYACRSFIRNRATAHIQTPLLAVAWEAVADASDDKPEFRTEALDELRTHYDWLASERDPDGDGLITILFPDESGMDDSPKYDHVYGWMAHHLPGYFWLVQRSRRLGYDAYEIVARHSEHVEDVLVNVAYALGLRSLSRLIGDDELYVARAEQVEQALLERCYDEQSGLFFDLAGSDERQVPISTWASLAPLALPDLPEDVRRRLVEEHLLHTRRYRAHTGIPSVALEEPTFNPHFDRFRCWRGPSWMPTAWFLVPPLRELGYHEEAERIVGSLAEAVERDGFREYYNPLTGKGLAAKRFGMSTLLVELLTGE
jgi:hypothetical protein